MIDHIAAVNEILKNTSEQMTDFSALSM